MIEHLTSFPDNVLAFVCVGIPTSHRQICSATTPSAPAGRASPVEDQRQRRRRTKIASDRHAMQSAQAFGLVHHKSRTHLHRADGTRGPRTPLPSARKRVLGRRSLHPRSVRFYHSYRKLARGATTPVAHAQLFCDVYTMASEHQPDRAKRCPVCRSDYLKLLTRNVYTDNSVTTYWRCPSCSHVKIEETPPEDGNAK